MRRAFHRDRDVNSSSMAGEGWEAVAKEMRPRPSRKWHRARLEGRWAASSCLEGCQTQVVGVEGSLVRTHMTHMGEGIMMIRRLDIVSCPATCGILDLERNNLALPAQTPCLGRALARGLSC